MAGRWFCSLLAKAVFHLTVFFVFHCSLLFYSYSKNLCRHKRGTKSQIDSLYKKSTYNLKSLIFKHSLLFIHTFKNTTQLLKTFFFVSQSLTNAISLPLIYSISSKHVGDFSAQKKKNWHFRFNFPHHTQAKVKSPPREGPANQIPHSPGTENGQMPGVCPGEVEMLKFRFDRRIKSSKNRRPQTKHSERYISFNLKNTEWLI